MITRVTPDVAMSGTAPSRVNFSDSVSTVTCSARDTMCLTTAARRWLRPVNPISGVKPSTPTNSSSTWNPARLCSTSGPTVTCDSGW